MTIATTIKGSGNWDPRPANVPAAQRSRAASMCATKASYTVAHGTRNLKAVCTTAGAVDWCRVRSGQMGRNDRK